MWNILRDDKSSYFVHPMPHGGVCRKHRLGNKYISAEDATSTVSRNGVWIVHTETDGIWWSTWKVATTEKTRILPGVRNWQHHKTNVRPERRRYKVREPTVCRYGANVYRLICDYWKYIFPYYHSKENTRSHCLRRNEQMICQMICHDVVWKTR